MRFNPPALEDIPSVREMVSLMDENVSGLEATKLRLALHMRRFMLAGLHGRGTPPQNVYGWPVFLL